MNKNYLIVTSILEGKHFPSRQGCDIVIEASFDGEVLTTDPVPHTCHPNFNTELAWGVDRRGLHVHRLHRTPVKLQCFAVERLSRKKERVGYVVLEIRGIQDGVRSAKWLSLLNSKYHGSKPEIHVGLHLEEDTVPDASAGASEPVRAEFKAQRVVAPQPADREAESDIEDLTPRLNLKDGCYEIGKDTKVLYLFTVTISFAANLSHLQGSSEERPSAGRGGRYHFVYHLLGHEVTTEAFSSLENPQFPAERASLHIRSSGPALRRFFAAHPTLQVLLSTDTDVIGETEIPLGDFSASSPKFSVSVQGLFQLHPVPHNEALVGSIAAEYRPIVGVHVEVAEKPQAAGVVEDESGSRQNVSVPEHRPAPPPPPPSFPIREESPHPAPRSRSREVRPRTPTRLAPERSPTRQPRKQLDFSPPQKLGRAENQRPSTNAATAAASASSGQAVDPRTLPSGPPETTAKRRLPELIDLTDEDENQFHHFSLMLDVRSLEVLSTRGKEMQCYIRYHYPFFGVNTPFQSQKWTTVVPSMLATVLGGFNTYNFAATYRMARMAFQELPLMVEILCRGEGSDRLFGTAEVSLGNVLRCPASTLVKDSGATGQRRMQTSKVSIMDTKGTVIGELQAVVCLDDLGITSLPAEEPKPGSLGGTTSRPHPTQAAAKAQEQEILRIMTELELWKEQQEIMFRTRLKEKEDAHLRALSEEWKRQDMERDAVLRRKLKENKELEEKLKSRLRDIESREEAQARREAEVELLKELHEALRQKERYREKCDHAENQLFTCKERLRQAQQRDFEAERDKVESLYQKAKARLENDPAPIATTVGSCPKSLSDDGATPEKTLPQHSAPAVQTTTKRAEDFPPAAPSPEAGKQGPRAPVVVEHSPPGASASSSSWMEHMRRLIEERDMLLSSGVYSKDDVIIVELNRHIADTVRKHV